MPVYCYPPDGHHSECDVLRTHVVCALDLVDLVRFGHYHAVMLEHDRVGVYASLKIEMFYYPADNIMRIFN